ncbi:Xaa-Pro dipeptidase [Aliidiomarina soli]|uniref:Xaa-Pro dipeptidase n=1 Tax=Aliidiomarina soli TaxID=1928574 RepID=A0A432WEJ4_9GAMM|nr:Xaa-Pro dipeptidase [Aliidiomarina soli]RUO31301.1 Xaa-Pro dipeptidase [Aliidiomarina soli]
MGSYANHISTVQSRFDEALQATGFDSVLIYSGQSQIAFLDDNPYPFRVNPLFKYWLPVTESPKSFIFYKAGCKPVVYLYKAKDFWHAPVNIAPAEWQDHMELKVVDNLAQVRSDVGDELTKTAYLGEQFEPMTSWQLGQVNPKALIDHLHYQRSEKTEWELENLRKANDLAAQAHVAARDAFYAGASEIEIQHAYLSAINFREQEVPYNSIIALNEHSAILHYDVYDRSAPSESRSFLIDAGALYNGYCADITRTYAAQKSGFYQELVEAMDKAEQAIIEAIRPGVSYYDLHVRMHHMVATILVDFGFFKISPEEVYERGYTNAFFPHGLGHYIGLQVHDVGGFLKSAQGDAYERDGRHPFLRLLRNVEPGQVFTIEPGLYVVDQLLEEFDGNDDFNWARIAELRPYGGVRIEDSVHVTNDGVENITRDAFAKVSKF